MKKQILRTRSLFLLIYAFIGINVSLFAQVNVTATSGTTGPSSYTNLSSAFSAINGGTHQGIILISISSNVTEPATPVQLLRSGAGSSAYQSVKIVPLGNVTIFSAITPAASRGIIEFIGADSVTIDGDDPATPGIRNLTIIMAITTANNVACIRFSSSTATGDGCLHATVKNCNIIGGRNSPTAIINSYGIFCGGSSATSNITTTSGASDNDSMLIENNHIQRCFYGIYAFGRSSPFLNLMDYFRIKNNVIGSSFRFDNVGYCGIYVANTQVTASANSLLIEGNDIQGGDSLTGFAASITGIELTLRNAGAIIRNNNIHNIENPITSGWGAYGIMISSAMNNSNIHIYNNFIRDIRAFHTTSAISSFTNHGIYINDATTNLRVNNNTIVLAKPNNGSGTSNFSSCFTITSNTATIAEFRNNILVNKQSDNTGQACNGIYLSSASIVSSAAMNNNNYFVTGASGNVGRITTINYPNLANWRAVSNKDSNSFFTDPPFISNTDLHLSPVKSVLESNGLTIVGISTDIDGEQRPGPVGSVNGGGLNFDIGADEADLISENFKYDSSAVMQVSGIVPAGSDNNALLRVAIYVSGSVGAPINITDLHLNTIGTTFVGDVWAAKVYFTGSSSTFNISNQFGSTITNPNGAFSVNDTQMLSSGVNYFWLSYDVISSAANNNFLDARIDSIVVAGIGRIPNNNNPSGALQVGFPMTYISSTSQHVDLSSVEIGSTNNRLLRIFIRTSATGAPIKLTKLDLNTNGGGNDAVNIANIKVFYTGSNPNFSTLNQFGSTFIQTAAAGSSWGSFSVNGIRPLQNDSNFFWVTYDIKSSAIVGDSVDSECGDLTIENAIYTPSITSPLGKRRIRNPYCVSSAMSVLHEEIWNVSFGTLNNTSNCTTLASGPGSVTGFYSNYTSSVAAPNIAAGLPVPFSVNAATCGTTGFPSILGIYIDYNQNGTFDLPSELAFVNNTFTSSTTGSTIVSGNITIPCTALSGNTRMRVVLIRATTGMTPCGTYVFGETEDYLINIVSGASSHIASNAIQFAGTTSSGLTDVRILRVPVVVASSPCNLGLITELRFNTAGTSNVSNIVNAKLYKTGNSNVFSLANLVGTVSSPSGQFSFSVIDTAVNDTNNYWLVYDISATAASSNTLDAVFDSIELFGNWQTPMISAPAGNLVITSPMTYLGSTVIHPDLTMVERPTSNVRMLRAILRMSSTGSPISITEFHLNANGGGDDTSNIANVKVFYTGNNPNFSTSNQFGSTFIQTNPIGNKFGLFSITGSLNLANDTNYFWVTYDIKPTAILFDSIDVECAGLTIAGLYQIPSITAPAGNRKIRATYCLPTYSSGCGVDFISRVRLGNLDNATGCNGQYTFYNSVAVPNLALGSTNTITLNYGNDLNQFAFAWIDYNSNGDFNDPGEALGPQFPANAGANGQAVITFTVPCSAQTGIFRLRIRGGDDVQPTATQFCGASGSNYGEGEDYLVNIVPSTKSYSSMLVNQQSGTTSAGAVDVKVLRVPVIVNSSACNPAIINELRFNTIGTTTTSNILNAKLYATRNSGNFSSANLIGIVFSPNGQFSFTVSDTMNNDTNFYWLTYDVAVTAANNNVLDARLDSINVINSWYMPSNGNPVGNLIVSTPVTYVSSTAEHTELETVESSSVNNRMLRVMVRMSSSGAPVTVSQLNLNAAGGGNDTANIANAKVFYTGNNPNFSANNQFGSTFLQTTPTGSKWGTFFITGNVNIGPDTNYFWVTYDIKGSALLGDSVDIACQGIIIAGVNQTPTVLSPAGSRKIRQPFCAAGALFPVDGEILNVTLSTLNNTTTCTSLASGAGSVLSSYNNYSESVVAPQIRAGERVSFNIHTATCGGNFAGVMGIWIDFNQDGDLTDAGETVAMTQAFQYGIGVFQTGSFYIPLNVMLGKTRMRVSLIETNVSPIQPCGVYAYGETEDYTIDILPTSNSSYVWNQTTGGNFATASNWTPARIKLNMSDMLTVSTGNAATFTGLISEKVRTITFGNNTQATFANATSELNIIDTLTLGNNVRLITNNNTFTLGLDTLRIGSIGVGSNAGVNGNLKRWFNSTVSSLSYPLLSNTGVSRSLTATFLSAPTVCGSLVGSFVQTPAGNLGLPFYDSTAFMTVNTNSVNGYWSFTPENGTTASVYDLNLNATGFAGVNNYQQLVAVRRANASSAWASAGVHLTASGSNSAPIVNRSLVSVYGQFTISSNSSFNPLPVELLSFKGAQVKGDAKLNWTTSSETNNKGFMLERSINGKDFIAVAFVNGAGNSKTMMNYAYTDVQPFVNSNVLFYRLEQEDFDGTIAYSNIVSVNIEEMFEEEIAVYPNPFSDKTGVLISASNNGNVTLEIVDILGRTVATQTNAIVAGSQYLPVNGLSQLNSGVYFIRVYNGKSMSTIKVQKVD